MGSPPSHDHSKAQNGWVQVDEGCLTLIHGFKYHVCVDIQIVEEKRTLKITTSLDSVPFLSIC